MLFVCHFLGFSALNILVVGTKFVLQIHQEKCSSNRIGSTNLVPMDPSKNREPCAMHCASFHDWSKLLKFEFSLTQQATVCVMSSYLDNNLKVWALYIIRIEIT